MKRRGFLARLLGGAAAAVGLQRCTVGQTPLLAAEPDWTSHDEHVRLHAEVAKALRDSGDYDALEMEQWRLR